MPAMESSCLMSQFWNPLVKRLDPYVPGEQPKDQRYIKLNTNENPYPPSPAAVEAMQQVLASNLGSDLRLYPDPEGTELKQAVADLYGLATQQVFLGNGSDEVLAHVFHGLFQPDKPVLFPAISYSFYPVYAGLYDLQAKLVPLRDDFSLKLADYYQENGGIIFPNPNAPTGGYVPLAEIEALLQHNTDSVVVVDEAYIAFGGETAIPLIEQYPNLLVVHTLSKSYSLAGLRVGFAVGQVALVEGLERIKNSFNSYPLDRLAIQGAAAALRDQPYFEKTRQQIMATRERSVSSLVQMGFRVLPSLANFIFVRPPQGNAQALYWALRQRGVLVRFFNQPPIHEYLRITVGTDEEMTQLLTHLQAMLE